MGLVNGGPQIQGRWFKSQRIAGLETRVYLRGLLWNLASLSIRPSGPALPLARRSPSATAWVWTSDPIPSAGAFWISTSEDPRYARQSQRNAREDEVCEIVSAWTRRHDKIAAMERLSEFGVACGAVLDTGEVLQNRHLRESGMIVEQDQPGWGRLALPGCPIRLDGLPPPITPAPALGADTGELFAERDEGSDDP